MPTTTAPGQEKKWIDLRENLARCDLCKNNSICKNVDQMTKAKNELTTVLSTNNNEAIEIEIKCKFYSDR